MKFIFPKRWKACLLFSSHGLYIYGYKLNFHNNTGVLSFPHSPLCGKVCGILRFHKIWAVSIFLKNSTTFFHKVYFSTKWFVEFHLVCWILKISWEWQLCGISLVEISPGVGRLRTELALGCLYQCRTLSIFFMHSSLWNSQHSPSKVPKQLFHKLVCGKFKTSLILD